MSASYEEKIRLLENLDMHLHNKIFSAWVTAQFRNSVRKYEVKDVTKDLRDGIVFNALIEVLSGKKNPVPLQVFPPAGFRDADNIHYRIQNIALALNHLKTFMPWIDIEPKDIEDGKAKVILGLIFQIILEFKLGKLGAEGPAEETAEQRAERLQKKLLEFLQEKTAGYPGVNVKDLGSSWHDGMALSALINKYDPSYLDWSKVPEGPEHAAERLAQAFRVAEQKMDIPAVLDVEDMTNPDPARRPNSQCIAAYLSEFPPVFLDQQEEMARRLAEEQRQAELQRQAEAARRLVEKERRRQEKRQQAERERQLRELELQQQRLADERRQLELQHQREAERQQHQSEVDRLQQQLEAARLRLQEDESKMQQEGQELQSRRDELARLAREVEEAQGRLSQTESALQESLSEQERLREEARKHLQELQLKHENLLRQRQEEIQGLEAAIREAQEAQARLLQQREAESQESKSRFDHQVQQSEAQMADLLRKLSDAQQRQTQLEDNIRLREQEEQRLQREAELKQQQLLEQRQQEKQKMEAELQQAQQIQQQGQAELKRRLEELARLQQQVDELQRRVQEEQAALELQKKQQQQEEERQRQLAEQQLKALLDSRRLLLDGTLVVTVVSCKDLKTKKADYATVHLNPSAYVTMEVVDPAHPVPDKKHPGGFPYQTHKTLVAAPNRSPAFDAASATFAFYVRSKQTDVLEVIVQSRHALLPDSWLGCTLVPLDTLPADESVEITLPLMPRKFIEDKHHAAIDQEKLARGEKLHHKHKEHKKKEGEEEEEEPKEEVHHRGNITLKLFYQKQN